MSSATVQINELRLRASGLTHEQAQRLGETVAKRLAELPLAPGQSRKIPAVNIRVRSSGTSSIERMTDEIALGIRRSLG
jgi:uncharacterized protein YoaH (UPF0181 family)